MSLFIVFAGVMYFVPIHSLDIADSVLLVPLLGFSLCPHA